MHKNKSLFVFISYLLINSLIISCVPTDDIGVDQILTCDCENINEKGNRFVGKGGENKLFDGAHNRSSVEFRSAKYSVLTDSKKRFALGHSIKNVNSDWYFRVSVWRKSKAHKGFLVAAAENNEGLYVASDKVSEIGINGWEKVEIDVFTPLSFNRSQLKIYVWNNTNDTIYFDDLKIERLKSKTYPDYNLQPLSIFMDTSDYIKIQLKRQQAFKNGILQSSDDDWVKGIVSSDVQLMKSKLRLKGDWLDHLNGKKWSFRIKLKKSFAWNGMRTYSIQTPSARGYLYEWVAHELFKENGLLTTRYGFIPVFLNGRSKGLYAWEEHFQKQLLESSKRREGPIVKFSEEAFWQETKINSKVEIKQSLSPYEASVIKPFGVNKTLGSPSLKNQFLNAQKLMSQYKNHTRKVDEIFDIKKLANYFALIDLTHGNHSRAWHNQRMYFNPVLCKLEPIAFDCFGEKHITYYGINTNYLYRILNTRKLNENEYDLNTFIFKDSVFVSHYRAYLEAYSSKEYIKGFMDSRATEIMYYDSLLKLEFPYFSYDNDWLLKSAKDIRNYLPDFRAFLEKYRKDDNFSLIVEEKKFDEVQVIEDTPEFFVNSYVKENTGDSLLIEVYNYYPNEIIIIGTSSKNKYVEFFEHPEPKIQSYKGKENPYYFSTDTAAKYLFFMSKGSGERFKTEILGWPFPNGNTPLQDLMELVKLEDNKIIDTIIGDKIHIKSGDIIVDNPIVIPSGYTVCFEPGTSIDFRNKSMFLSFSSVQMVGSLSAPIKITSSDFSANGFTVIQGQSRSNLENVIFENLNTLDYKGWTITGAVNFYENDVDINNATFYRNQCEDALNIIRSDFIVQNSKFENIYSDAFDSDFCTGIVRNTTFNHIGNDAIDFSGSQISIFDTDIINANDKGISGGEDSQLKLYNINISESNIGIASKDKSQLEVKGVVITNCNYGLVLLQKKPEYGPAFMKLTDCEIISPKTKFLIEKGSEIIFNGIIMKGDTENVAEMFY